MWFVLLQVPAVRLGGVREGVQRLHRGVHPQPAGTHRPGDRGSHQTLQPPAGTVVPLTRFEGVWRTRIELLWGVYLGAGRVSSQVLLTVKRPLVKIFSLLKFKTVSKWSIFVVSVNVFRPKLNKLLLLSSNSMQKGGVVALCEIISTAFCSTILYRIPGRDLLHSMEKKNSPTTSQCHHMTTVPFAFWVGVLKKSRSGISCS